jgi:hypothetical protein
MLRYQREGSQGAPTPQQASTAPPMHQQLKLHFTAAKSPLDGYGSQAELAAPGQEVCAIQERIGYGSHIPKGTHKLQKPR